MVCGQEPLCPPGRPASGYLRFFVSTGLPFVSLLLTLSALQCCVVAYVRRRSRNAVRRERHGLWSEVAALRSYLSSISLRQRRTPHAHGGRVRADAVLPSTSPALRLLERWARARQTVGPPRARASSPGPRRRCPDQTAVTIVRSHTMPGTPSKWPFSPIGDDSPPDSPRPRARQPRCPTPPPPSRAAPPDTRAGVLTRRRCVSFDHGDDDMHMVMEAANMATSTSRCHCERKERPRWFSRRPHSTRVWGAELFICGFDRFVFRDLDVR